MRRRLAAPARTWASSLSNDSAVNCRGDIGAGGEKSHLHQRTFWWRPKAGKVCCKTAVSGAGTAKRRVLGFVRCRQRLAARGVRKNERKPGGMKQLRAAGRHERGKIANRVMLEREHVDGVLSVRRCRVHKRRTRAARWPPSAPGEGHSSVPGNFFCKVSRPANARRQNETPTTLRSIEVFRENTT